jgi:hypothetical protein
LAGFFAAGHKVGHQNRLPIGGGVRLNDAGGHTGLRFQIGFNFAQLHAEAAHLELKVGTAVEDQVTIG